MAIQTKAWDKVFWALLCVGALVFSLYLYADINGTVLISGDDIWFQPVIYTYAETGELAHPFLSPVKENPSGALIWHGWLMPKIMGEAQSWFGGFSGIAQAKFSSHLVAMVVFLGFGISAFRRFGALRTLLLLPIFLGLFLYQAGRPEIIASGILLGFFWVIDWHHSGLRTVAIAICVALVAITSPVLGLYLALITGILLFSSDLPRLACWRVIAMQFVLVPVLVFVSTVIFTELPAQQWVLGIIEHSKRLAGRSDGVFFEYFVLNLRLPLMALLIVVLGFWGVDKSFYNQKFEIWLGVITLAGLVYFTAIRVPPTVYNLAWLFPLVIFTHPPNGHLAYFSRGIRITILVWLSIGFSASVMFYGVLAVKNIGEGVQASELMLELENLPEEKLFLTDSYSLAAKALVVPVWGDEKFVDIAGDAHYRVTFQSITNLGEPEIDANECLVGSTYHQNPLTIFGKPLWFSRQDWAYAVIQMQDCP